MPRPTTLLIADDQPEMRGLLAALLQPLGCEFLFASSGPETLEMAAAQQPDLLLLDVMMPGMDGVEVCRHLRALPITSEMPIIMVTALDDQQSRLAGIEAGADDFISKPFNRAELRARVRTIIRLNRYRRLHDERSRFEHLFVRSPDGIVAVDADGIVRLVNPALINMSGFQNAEQICGRPMHDLLVAEQHSICDALLAAAAAELAYVDRRELSFLHCNGQSFPVEVTIGSYQWDSQRAAQVIVRDISERKRAEATIQALNAELLDAYDATLEGWSRALDLRDHETEGHSRRVTDLTVALASELGMSAKELTHVRRGALLHDIGKMGIPDQILRKAGPLNEQEWEIMRLHPVYAYELLRTIRFLEPALDIPYYHHERWDGSGYPIGLSGETIPLSARIFAVVDVWDAMTNDRPYRAALPADEVLAHLRKRAGIDFDPRVVQAFLRIMEQAEPEEKLSDPWAQPFFADHSG